MGKITSLRARKGRQKRVSIFLDGKFAFSLEAEVVAREGLQVDQMLSAEQIEALGKSDHFHRCLNAATHYLGYRPRSESELRKRLRQRGFDQDIVEPVITRLKEQGLVDDAAFARFWKDNREWFSPRSRWLTSQELKQKGVAHNIIDQTVNEIEDDDSAYRAAMDKAHNLPRSNRESFCRRLGDYLRRRGFEYAVINHVVGKIWQELQELKDSEEI